MVLAYAELKELDIYKKRVISRPPCPTRNTSCKLTIDPVSPRPAGQSSNKCKILGSPREGLTEGKAKV